MDRTQDNECLFLSVRECYFSAVSVHSFVLSKPGHVKPGLSGKMLVMRGNAPMFGCATKKVACDGFPSSIVTAHMAAFHGAVSVQSCKYA